MTERAPAAPFHDAVTRKLAELGKTKTWLHQHSGVARTTINKWAHQQTPPHPKAVMPVADALGIPRTEALRLAGVLADVTVEIDGAALPLAEVDTDLLLAEIRRRIPDE